MSDLNKAVLHELLIYYNTKARHTLYLAFDFLYIFVKDYLNLYII